ncbi:dihydrolipoamide acetyltransferase family protein [Nocardioides caldifontis]|uniref:dihydrolipoamide acetyltransferase family protein n=1 Tax=Nocardioides caldifontis TaxID=2588938 RepID=UPI0011DFBB4F|nr:dihydrolipoamide acetyltransferase family protein [Nocardioides caldifontis]
MPTVLRMPEVAANATEAVLSEWLVAEGAEFGALDAIATVETEKAVVDVEAEAAGVVLKTLVAPGSQVEVGSPIAVLGSPGEAVEDLDAVLARLGVEVATESVVPERREVPDPPPVDPESGAPVTSGPSVPPVPLTSATPTPPRRQNGRVFASPLARRIARDSGLALEELVGTGPRGRILRRDVEAALETRPAAQEAPPVLAPSAAGEVPHSRLRRAIANRLTESKQTAPHFYVRATVRADALVAMRAEINGGDVKVSLNDLVVKAVGAAHRAVPEMNVVWTPDAVRTFDTVDVAVAVATERGLLTPVVRDVNALTVGAVSSRIRDLAERARGGKLKQDELEGGTISVTNLGMYGVEEFAAIINPPHAAILAVGAVRDEPVVEDGAVVPGKLMTVTLSVDHRPVDGVVAARWLAALKELLEHPARLLA